jgi:hypothetical protein
MQRRCPYSGSFRNTLEGAEHLPITDLADPEINPGPRDRIEAPITGCLPGAYHTHQSGSDA